MVFNSQTLDTCKKLIPDGIVTIGECVGQLSVTDLLNVERPYIEVVVVEVFSPSFFWIQLRKKQKAFTQFMDDLQYVELHYTYRTQYGLTMDSIYIANSFLQSFLCKKIRGLCNTPRCIREGLKLCMHIQRSMA